MQKKGQKETGAYYTSDAITAFMSEQSILPDILGRVKAQFGTPFERFQDIFSDFNHTRIRQICLYLIKDVLPEFTVLDNACGSGAFLLAALNVLVEVYSHVIYPVLDEPILHDLVHAYLEHYGKDETWLQWEFDSFNTFSADPRWRYCIKRQIIKMNIYGVDLDKDAIEDAKSRLWHSVASELSETLGAINPLPNIEYNLRWGNSLVGYVRLRPRGGLDQILSVDRLDHYIAELRTIYPGVQKQLEKYARSPTIGNLIKIRGILIQKCKEEPDLEKIRQLNTIIAALFEELHRGLNQSHFHTIARHWPGKKPIITSQYFCFIPFHWIAEFPDVLLKHGGFDIVLGNPPYITMKKQTKVQKGIYSLKFRTFHANGDVYYLFIERSFALLNPRGTFSYIIPRYFLKAPTAKLLRKFLAEQSLRRIYDFGQSSVFQGVGIHTLILLANPPSRKAGFSGIYSREVIEQFQTNHLNREQVSYTRADLQQDNWLFLPPAEQEIFQLIHRDVAGHFSDFCVLSKGLQTGKDEVFVVNEEKRKHFQIETEAVVPFLKGSSISRFFIHDDDQLSLIFSPSHAGDAVIRLPKCAAYLRENQAALEDRTRVPEWYQWRLGDERVTLHWKQPKIITASRGKRNVFAIDRSGYYFSQDITFIQPLPAYDQYLYYFWAVLNSTITRLLMRWQFKELAEDVYEIFPEQLQKIPVKIPDAPTLEHINTVMREIERQASAAPVEDAFRAVDALIYHIYTGRSLPP